MCTVLYWNSNTALSFWNAGFQEVVKFTKSKKKTNTLTIPFFWDRFVPKNYVLNGTHMCVLLQLILSNFWLLCTQQWSKFCTRGASIGWKHDLISKLSSVICILKITSVALIRTKTFVLEIETFFFFLAVFCVLLKLVNSGVNQILAVHRICLYSFIMFECVRWDCCAQYYTHCRGLVDFVIKISYLNQSFDILLHNMQQ